jgi:thioredoxin-related protein
MKTKLTAIALLLVPILSLRAAPLAFEEVLLLVRTHETDSFISQQLAQRRLLHALTARQEAALKEQGASEVLLQALRNPNVQLSEAETAAFETRREQQKTAMQEQAQQEAVAAREAATRAAAQAASRIEAAANCTWLTNYNKALELARAENKTVLLDFTGSDWCGWCTRMVKETFNQKEFANYAAKNLVLVEVDFPHNKVQSEELKAQNAELQRKFGGRGYPNFVLLDKEGKPLGRQSGYLEGGPRAFIAKLEGFKAGSR